MWAHILAAFAASLENASTTNACTTAEERRFSAAVKCRANQGFIAAVVAFKLPDFFRDR
jgi:hypothetical protein